MHYHIHKQEILLLIFSWLSYHLPGLAKTRYVNISQIELMRRVPALFNTAERC